MSNLKDLSVISRGASLALALVFASTFAPSAAAFPQQRSWEVASEFSDSANPSGVWSYGYEPTLGGAFTLFTNPVNSYGGKLRGWDLGTSTPASTSHNTRDHAVTLPFSGGPVRYQPHGLSMHPSFACEYAVARFTVPHTAKLQISGQFYGMDENGFQTTTDVHILLNNTPVYDGVVDIPAATPNASFLGVSVLAHAHDTIDFAVGCGSNGAWNYDTTGLNAVIVAP